MTIRKFSFLVFLFSICFITCRKDKAKVGNGYPQEISNILVNKCATAGCHTRTSKDAAAGLSTETWDDLFEGDRNGAVCIPYRHDYSTIFLFTNTDPSKGPVNMPTMPLNHPPLSADEMKTLSDWIDAGAQSSSGKIAFADSKKKIYVTNQGCNVVTVFDAATQLQMRYVNVGDAFTKTPHMIKVSPDKKYWYVVFSGSSSTYLQKYNASDDSYVSQVNITPGSWNTLAISNDSKYGFAVDWKPDGRVAYIDLQNMSLINPNPIWGGGGFLPDAHGSSINAKGDTFYLTSQSGSYIMKIPVNDPGSMDTVNFASTTTPFPELELHEVAFSPDSAYYFVTCQKTNEVRVKRVADDALVAIIPVGVKPLEMAFSKTKPYLFVSCELDTTPPLANRGAVSIIELITYTEIKRLRLGFSEPHGIAVDDASGLIYVGNRNISGGSVPHHTSVCAGTNGFVSFIDLNTLEVIPGKNAEIAVDPYSIAVRP